MTHDDTEGGLESLREVPAPRRTDDAFARSVADGVAKARAPRWLFLPAVAAGAAAITFVVVHEPPPPVVALASDAGHDVRADVRDDVRDDARDDVRDDARDDVSAQREDDDIDDDDLGGVGGGRDDFALPSLDGSDEQELLALEAKLDEALKKL